MCADIHHGTSHFPHSYDGHVRCVVLLPFSHCDKRMNPMLDAVDSFLNSVNAPGPVSFRRLRVSFIFMHILGLTPSLVLYWSERFFFYLSNHPFSASLSLLLWRLLSRPSLCRLFFTTASGSTFFTSPASSSAFSASSVGRVHLVLAVGGDGILPFIWEDD